MPADTVPGEQLNTALVIIAETAHTLIDIQVHNVLSEICKKEGKRSEPKLNHLLFSLFFSPPLSHIIFFFFGNPCAGFLNIIHPV